MRDTTLILIAVLMAVAGMLALATSGADYAAEKLFYQAMKAHREIALNPDVVPPGMLSRVERNLQTILQRYPKSKTAKVAHLVLAEFYFNNKEYEQAIASLDIIIDTYSDDVPTLSKAHFLKGNSYEKQNQWDRALREYITLRDKYTNTPLALQVPLYIGSYYKGKKRYTQANQAYHEATIFYKKIERENSTKPRGYAAASLLLQAYIELGEYEQAGKTVEDIINNYPQLIVLVQQVVNIDSIFIKKLNKHEKAIELYKLIKTKTKNPELKGALDKKIEFLRGQKEF